MLTALIIAGLIIYIIHLSSRITKIELMLQGKSAPAQPQSYAQANQAVQAQVAQQPTQHASMPAPAAQPMSAPQTHSMDSKGFINALPKIGVVALVIGLGFFLKYAIDQGWISIYARLAIGGAVGALFLILFYLWKDKYTKYAMVLAGGGLAIWYLTTFAAVRMYNLMSTNSGLIVLVGVTVIGLLLAYKTKSAALSAMAWGGAFLAPILLSVGADSYSTLLIYLTVLSVALLTTIYYNHTRTLFALVIVGTGLNLLFALFTGAVEGAHYYLHTLLFLSIHLVANTFVISAMIRNAGSAATETDQKEFSVLLLFIYAILGFPISVIAYGHFRDYSSLIMLAVGAWTFIIYTLHDRLELHKVNYLLSALGAVALTLAVIWQFNGNMQPVALYVLGLIGIIVGTIQKRFEIRTAGLAIILAGIISASLIQYNEFAALIANAKFGLEVLGLAVLGVSYFMYKEDSLTEFEHDVHKGLQYIIAGLLWFFVSWDLVNYYGQFGQENQRNLSLSIWWLVFGVMLFCASIMKALKPLRKIALLLFGLVIVKVFLYDVQSLDTVYRIISFISLGVILLIVSFAYQHNKEKIKQLLE